MSPANFGPVPDSTDSVFMDEEGHEAVLSREAMVALIEELEQSGSEDQLRLAAKLREYMA